MYDDYEETIDKIRAEYKELFKSISNLSNFLEIITKDKGTITPQRKEEL